MAVSLATNQGKTILWPLATLWSTACVRTQNIWLLGLTFTCAHNLFVLWAFEFPTMGGSMLDIPKYTPIFPSLSLFLTESLFRSLWVFYSFLSILPKIANPFSSFSPPIYRLGWVEELWLLLLLSANGGPIPSS